MPLLSALLPSILITVSPVPDAEPLIVSPSTVTELPCGMLTCTSPSEEIITEDGSPVPLITFPPTLIEPSEGICIVALPLPAISTEALAATSITFPPISAEPPFGIVTVAAVGDSPVSPSVVVTLTVVPPETPLTFVPFAIISALSLSLTPPSTSSFVLPFILIRVSSDVAS